MHERPSIRQSGEYRKPQRAKSMAMVLLLRWIAFVPLLAWYLTAQRTAGSVYAFYETLAVAAVYNLLVTFSCSGKCMGKRRLPIIFLYVDVFILSIFIYLSGGIYSDAYLLLIFMIGYYGIYNDATHLLKYCLYCIIVYSIACSFEAQNANVALGGWNLAIKDCFLMLTGLGISFISHEVKRYNEMHKKEFRMARTDRLTGLANRHYYEQKLKEEVEYADMSGNALNILIFDLDNFKSFNDTYGHSSGDKLLTLFSDIIKQNIRKVDTPIRYGGEEFMLLIRDLDIYIAKSVGERIRRQLEKQHIYIGDGETKRRVTVSCGIAQYPTHADNIKEAIDLADQALYHVKKNGKNMVAVYNEIIQSKNSREKD